MIEAIRDCAEDTAVNVHYRLKWMKEIVEEAEMWVNELRKQVKNVNERTCRTCKWAELPMTKHTPPRVNPNLSGICLFPLPSLKLPVSVTGSFGYHPLSKGSIWAGSGEACPCWEDKIAV